MYSIVASVLLWVCRTHAAKWLIFNKLIILISIGRDVVGEAENGALGLILYQRPKFDFVLLDIEMPVKDGVPTLNQSLHGVPRTLS